MQMSISSSEVLQLLHKTAVKQSMEKNVDVRIVILFKVSLYMLIC